MRGPHAERAAGNLHRDVGVLLEARRGDELQRAGPGALPAAGHIWLDRRQRRTRRPAEPENWILMVAGAADAGRAGCRGLRHHLQRRARDLRRRAGARADARCAAAGRCADCCAEAWVRLIQTPATSRKTMTPPMAMIRPRRCVSEDNECSLVRAILPGDPAGGIGLPDVYQDIPSVTLIGTARITGAGTGKETDTASAWRWATTGGHGRLAYMETARHRVVAVPGGCLRAALPGSVTGRGQPMTVTRLPYVRYG